MIRRYDPRTQYRPAFVRWMTIFLWALAVVIGWGLADNGTQSLLRGVPWVLLVLVVAPVVLFWLPEIRVDDDGVTVVNLVTRVRVPFDRLVGVDTKFSLTLRCDDGRAVGVWCAPAGSGRRSIRWARPGLNAELGRVVGDTQQGSVAASAVPGSDSGNAALLVTRAWTRWKERDAEAAGEPGGPIPTDEPVARAVRWPVVVTCGIVAAACLITLFR